MVYILWIIGVFVGGIFFLQNHAILSFLGLGVLIRFVITFGITIVIQALMTENSGKFNFWQKIVISLSWGCLVLILISGENLRF